MDVSPKKDDIWYCRTCTKNIFLFHKINNTQLHKISINKRKPQINDKKILQNTIKTTTCNICAKRNKIINIHGLFVKLAFFNRVCCKLKLIDIHETDKDKK